MKKKKTGVAKQAEQNRKDAHALDERVKSLHASIHATHQGAKQFHKAASSAKRKSQVKPIKNLSVGGITEEDLKISANQQAAEMALVGNRNVQAKRKSA